MPNLPNERAFMLKNFMSAEECATIIAATEQIKYQSIDWEYTPDYRHADRLVARSADLAEAIWQRLLPFLTRDDLFELRPFGFGARGTWQPISVNDVIRFTRYNKDGHFKMHRDGAFVYNDETRSILTLMIYLNDGYTGGETQFLDNSRAPPQPVVVKGEAGAALVFNHDAEHMGCPVTSGTKYIMRTDVMFRRIESVEAPLSYLADPAYHEAMALYDKSIALQRAGDPRGSTEAYLAALEMQARMRSVPMPVGPEAKALPRDVYVHIFARLSLPDLMRAALVSRAWKRLARDPSVWRNLFEQRFPDYAPLQLSVDDAHKDWYVIFKRHNALVQHFNVLVVDVGCKTARAATLATSDYIAEEASVLEIGSGHYWGAGTGICNMKLGWRDGVEDWDAVHRIFGPVSPGDDDNVECMSVARRVQMAVCALADGTFESNVSHFPVLFARSPAWPPALEPEVREYLASDVYEGYSDSASFYAAADAPLLIAFAHNKTSALVVSLGAASVYACVVWDGAYEPKSLRLMARTEEQADEFFARSTHLETIVAEIRHCMASVPAERHAALWSSVLISGGRATSLAKGIDAKLQSGSAHVINVYRSASPGQDVVRGGLRMAHLSNARSLFAPLKRLTLKAPNEEIFVECQSPRSSFNWSPRNWQRFNTSNFYRFMSIPKCCLWLERLYTLYRPKNGVALLVVAAGPGMPTQELSFVRHLALRDDMKGLNIMFYYESRVADDAKWAIKIDVELPKSIRRARDVQEVTKWREEVWPEKRP